MLCMISSAGPSFVPLQGNMGSSDRRGLGSRKGSLSGASVGLPRPAVSANTAGASTPHSRKASCRPWDREDLLIRLSTFKSNSWSRKLLAISPLACARRGWASVEGDIMSCDGCGTQIKLSTPSLSQEQVESTADILRKQLESGHQTFCPWKENQCPESLVEFPSTPASALIGGYNYRCEALLQLPYLPTISVHSICEMRRSRSAQIDHLLEQPPPTLHGLSGTNPAEGVVIGSLEEIGNGNPLSFYEAQKIISLCGWEIRLLREIPDCEDHSAHSARNMCSAGPSKVSSQKPQGCRSNEIFSTGKEKQIGTKKMKTNKKETVPMDLSPVSVFLDCSFCGASFSLSTFSKVFRPCTALDGAFPRAPESHKQYGEVPLRGASAASGIDGWLVSGGKGKICLEQEGEAGLACSAADDVTLSNAGMLNLGLTIAGGPPPTMLGPQAAAITMYEPASAIQALLEQPEVSETGEHGVASYESRGPTNPYNGADQGFSSIGAHHSDMMQVASPNVDGEGCEIEVGETKSFPAESSKRKRTADSSAVDQISLGMAVTGPVSKDEGTNEPDSDCEVQGKLKKPLHHWSSLHSDSNKVTMDGGLITEFAECSRKRDDLKDPGNVQEGDCTRWLGKDLGCSSSVNATYTCFYNAQENSAESVEYMPDSSVLNHTAGSVEYDFEGPINKPNIVHVQQSDYQSCQLRTTSVASHDFPVTDRAADEVDATNVAVVSSDTDVVGGTSVEMALGSDRQDGRVEAEVREELNVVDSSVHQRDSPGGDAEVVFNTAGHMGDFTPDGGMTGECVPEESDKAQQNVVQEGSLSLCPGIDKTSNKECASTEGCWGESGVKTDQRESLQCVDEWTQDTTNAVLMGGESVTFLRGETDGWVEAANRENEQAAANSIAITCEERDATDARFAAKVTNGFDPVCYHRHFCPWINGNIVAAASNDGSFGTIEGLCLWQLTLDALEVFQKQGGVLAGVTESESTASMCKVVSGQQTSRSVSPKQQFSACG